MPKTPAKILIVDDDADVLTAARVVLRQLYESVETESNPQRLHALLQQNRYDVILLDMNYAAGRLSGHEGLFWLNQIMARNPRRTVKAPRIMEEVYRVVLQGMMARGWEAPRTRVSVGPLRLSWIAVQYAII